MRQEYLETLKEAKLTIFGLIFLIIFWLMAGILLSNVEVKIYYIPLWAIVGTIGVWITGVAISIVLSKTIRNMKLE